MKSIISAAMAVFTFVSVGTAGEKPNVIYILADDLGQINNLIDQYPEKVRELEHLLKRIREDGYPSISGSEHSLNAENRSD